MRGGRDCPGSDQRTAWLVIDLQQALCDAAPREAIKQVTANTTFGLSHGGNFGSRIQSHGVTGSARIRF